MPLFSKLGKKISTLKYTTSRENSLIMQSAPLHANVIMYFHIAFLCPNVLPILNSFVFRRYAIELINQTVPNRVSFYYISAHEKKPLSSY